MNRFKRVYIEITNVCNLSCSFCPKTKREPEFMKLDTFESILKQIKPYAEYIYFHVKGEPLLHPELDNFLDLSHEMGFKVNITTNGTLVNKTKNKLMGKEALRQINFSLHSFDKNDGCIDMNEYINNIFSFTREALEKSNMIIAYRLWNLDKDNATNLEKRVNQNILTLIEEEYNLPYKIEDKINPIRGIKISDRVYLNQDHEFQWPALDAEEDFNDGFCYGLRNQIAILVDGTVVPCCLDGEGIINLGNINKINFTEIIEGNRAKVIFEGFSDRRVVEELCRKCGYRRRFT